MEDIKVKVEVGVKITQEDLDDIMSTALEGGINYWCRKAEVVGEYLGEFAHEQISRGGTLKLYDEDVGVRTLDLKKLINGIKMYLENPERPYDILNTESDSVGCSKGDYTLDCCAVDGVVADMIIRYALFDDVIFG